MTAAVVDVRRSPFDDTAPATRLSPTLAGALAVALAVHVGLGAYLWKARFEPQYRSFAEDPVTRVELIKPVPPPPPRPPKTELPPPPPPPPPRVQPRPPKATLSPPTVPPLPVPPVIQRLEVRPPPAIQLAPPPKPAPPPPPPAPPVVTNPDWLRRPTGAEVARYYPERAARRGVEGRAVIHCRVTAAGQLTGCQVTAEDPDDEAFGAAALKMSRHFKLRPMTRDGEPVSGGQITIPIRFQLPE